MLAHAFAPGAHAAPAWSFDPPSWDFGTLVPGSGPIPPKAFTLTNTGDVELSAIFVSVGGNEGAGFKLAGNTCGKLAPGASCEISVTFDPSTPGPKDGQLQAATQGGLAPPASAELSGTGAGPEASIAPRSLSFPALPLGEVSEPRTFTLTNTGSIDLTISWLAIVIYLHGDTDQFRTTGGTCAAGLTLPPAGECTVETRFAPSRPGQLIADLLISSDAPGSPHRVELVGFGTAPTLTPAPPPPFLEPRAAIVHRPSKRTRKRHAAFWLRGSPTAARFVCKLDHQPYFTVCRSAARYRKLRPGRHRFAVRALDGNGRWGRPTVFRWRVVKRGACARSRGVRHSPPRRRGRNRTEANREAQREEAPQISRAHAPTARTGRPR
ncbi:MAG TPA: choice-of-anchor D domain-containing protein [Solirubrobacterales bacterium]|nr:choice-of-anchor D domain-containing protein [Solirubrobacterales bacterium]